MRALAHCAALLLCGCWTGDQLYADADARSVIPPGSYRFVSDDEQIDVRIRSTEGGMTRLEAEGETRDYALSPIDNEGRRYVSWERVDTDQAYVLIERRSDGDYLLHYPSCEGEEADMARAAGADVGTGMLATCRFRSRESLEGALRQLRPAPGSRSVRLVRIGD